MRDTTVHRRKRDGLAAPVLAILISILLLVVAPVFEPYFNSFMNIASFLSWHNLLEIAGVIAYLSIFMVSFYTYSQEGKLKVIILGSILLAAGIIDVFHMLSYKGMPDFFIENLTANRATTFWIAARLLSAIGYASAAFMDDDRRSSINGYYFLVCAIFISLFAFVAATYFSEYFPAMYVEGVGLTWSKKLLEYVIMTITAIAAVSYMHKYINEKKQVLLVMFSALVLSIMSEFAFTIYVDVYSIYNFLGHILKCISLFMVFSVVFSKNVLAPYIALTATQKELRDYADNLDKIVAQRTSQLQITNERLVEDLEYARDIQKSMLPSFFPDTAHVGFDTLYLPAERLSGDFYDVFLLDDGHIGFYVCDVSGHGVPAAMLTVFLKQCVDNIIEVDRTRGCVSPPSGVMTQIYDAFNNTNFRDEVYIVLIYFIYNMKENKLVFCSAGMNERPIYIDRKGQLRDIEIKGFPICKLKEVYNYRYTDMELIVESGDRLFIFTDGLAELKDNNGVPYSADRLKTVLSGNCDKVQQEMTNKIRQDLLSYAGCEKSGDDITLLSVEFK